MSTENDLKEKLTQCINQIQLYRDKLKTNQTEFLLSSFARDFDSIAFKTKLIQVSTVISSDATKLALACKPPRSPADVIPVLDIFCTSLSRLVECYSEIPFDKVVCCYRTTYLSSIDGIMQAAQHFLSVIISKADRQTELYSTGTIWESCKSLEKTLPADNTAAVASKWRISLELAEDNQREVKEEEETNEIVLKVVNLSVLLLKLIGKQCLPLIQQSDVSWADNLCLAMREVPDALDDLVCEYEDGDNNESQRSLKACHAVVLNLIKIAKERVQGNGLAMFEKCESKYDEIVCVD